MQLSFSLPNNSLSLYEVNIKLFLQSRSIEKIFLRKAPIAVPNLTLTYGLQFFCTLYGSKT